MVLYLCRMFQCGLHVVLWSHIAILMHLLAAELHSSQRRLFAFQCLCGMILLTLFDGVGLAGFMSRANAFLLALLLAPFLSFNVFPLSLLSF